MRYLHVRLLSAFPISSSVCSGDATNQWITKADASSNSERGYIQDPSASGIRAAIEDDAMTNPVVLNQQVTMTGGAKSRQRSGVAKLH